MPEASEYKFSLEEVAVLLAKHAGLTSGHWQLIVEFGFAAITAGPNEKDVKPTGMVAVNKLGLSRVEVASPLSIDASKLGAESTA